MKRATFIAAIYCSVGVRHLYIKLCLCKRNAIKWQFKAQRCQLPNTQGSKVFFPTHTYRERERETLVLRLNNI